MRNIRQHGITGTTDSFELRLVPNHLYLESVNHSRTGDHRCACFGFGHLQVLNRLGAAVDPRLKDWAAEIAGAATVFKARFENVTAELAHCLLGRYVEEACCLRVEIADDAVFVDGIHAFDDAAEHRLGLCLAAAESAGH